MSGGGTFIRHQRVEHLEISLELQMKNIINIQADDIFIEKFPQALFEAKQIT